ncbi:contact-dependent growth inhibition system immunity protein [Serratia sp. 1D1416]|uniref:contact-dependent growth inhibition system immunity protein n=1 Tax=Serratia sp. 1D1416 TaxID=2447890 RepID=UPI001013CB51|nr:contact-dependent growth inhibition system immunity protein [Serratia sp. 1D1416]
MASQTPNLGTLVRVFFGQDYDLFGESVEEILESYRDTENVVTVQKTVNEAQMLLGLYPEEKQLEVAFTNLAEGEFSPTAWGYSVRAFLEKIIQTLSEIHG